LNVFMNTVFDHIDRRKHKRLHSIQTRYPDNVKGNYSCEIASLNLRDMLNFCAYSNFKYLNKFYALIDKPCY